MSEVFPGLHDGSTPQEPWDHRFKPLADMLGCSIDSAADAFRYLEFPEYLTAQHLDATRDKIGRLNRAIKPAERLLRELRTLSAQERDDLYRSGTVTIQQIEHLLDVLTGEAESLKGWYSRQARGGGRIVAAHAIAEGVRRAFRRQRKRITYGVSGGWPTTLFGRAVQGTIAAFGVRADWSEPAQRAFNKQRGIELRLSRIRSGQERQRGLISKYPALEGSRFVVRWRGTLVPDQRVALLDRNDMKAPFLVLPHGAFVRGEPKVREQVAEWVAARAADQWEL